MRNLFATSLLLIGLCLAAPAAAQTRGFADGKPAKTPTMRSLIPRMSSDEAYSERYGFAVDLDGGGHIGVDFTISNLGFGDGKGAASVRVHLPGHTKYDFQKKVDEDEWSYSKSGFGLDIANTSVEGKGKGTFVVKHDGEKVKFALTFRNLIPMWQPGDGSITVGDDGYYTFNIIAPRAAVTGRVFVDGKWVEVHGKRSGYADHVATNVAPFDLANRFMRFRDYNKDLFIVWREIAMTPDNGNRSFTWIMIGYKNQVVFADASAHLKMGAVTKDEKTGYRVPHAIQIDGKSGSDSVRLILRGHGTHRKDLLASYGTAAKLIAATVSKPYQYDIPARYTVQMTIGGVSATVKGRGHYTIDYLNH